jgi:hypothetical protein
LAIDNPRREVLDSMPGLAEFGDRRSVARRLVVILPPAGGKINSVST